MRSILKRQPAAIKKAVHFGADLQLQVHEVDRISDAVADQLWWTQEEIADMERESETIVYFMNNASGPSCLSRVDLDIHSVRGLEKKTEMGAWEMYETQRDARNAVLCQQDKHRKLGRQSATPSGNRANSLDSGMQIALDVQEAIAKVYRTASLQARRAAYEVGLKDQIEATRDDDKSNQLPTPLPVHQKCSKVVAITAEPMVPKWGRKISMPLMDPSDNSETYMETGATKKVNPMKMTIGSDRNGTVPRIRSSLSPLKTRRPKSVSDSCPILNERNNSMTAPTRSSSPRRKLSTTKTTVVREHAMKQSTSQEKLVVSKIEADKTTPKRCSSPRRKVTGAGHTSETTTTTPARSSQSKNKAAMSQLGDILFVPNELDNLENSSRIGGGTDKEETNDSNRLAKGDKDRDRSLTRKAIIKKLNQCNDFDKSIINKLDASIDIVGENHRLIVITKKKKHSSKESNRITASRPIPRRSVSGDSKGNHTAVTEDLLDSSNSSFESDSYDSVMKNGSSVSSQSVLSNNDSSTTLASLLKRMGGERNKNKRYLEV
jgi:hypothetical protein